MNYKTYVYSIESVLMDFIHRMPNFDINIFTKKASNNDNPNSIIISNSDHSLSGWIIELHDASMQYTVCTLNCIINRRSSKSPMHMYGKFMMHSELLSKLIFALEETIADVLPDAIYELKPTSDDIPIKARFIYNDDNKLTELEYYQPQNDRVDIVECIFNSEKIYLASSLWPDIPTHE